METIIDMKVNALVKVFSKAETIKELNHKALVYAQSQFDIEDIEKAVDIVTQKILWEGDK